MLRTVVPEELDHLAPQDPDAIRSRNDLRRIHRAMGTCSLLARELNQAMSNCLGRTGPLRPLRVLELGAGDASLMLRVAGALNPAWPKVQLTLLDQVDLLDSPTRNAYNTIGWDTAPLTLDALEWARQQVMEDAPLPDARPVWDLVIANLFLHHFEAQDLRLLLAAIAQSSSVFVALEPKRSGFALAASCAVGLLGANRVTRGDAVTSVRAGFSGTELTELWPSAGEGWSITERPAGLFSHSFRAERTVVVALD